MAERGIPKTRTARGNACTRNPGRAGAFHPQIEHRLFSHISSNWRGQTLVSHEVVVNLIGATTIRTGLTVHAELDHADYQGIKISAKQIREPEARAITRHDWHGEWNYTLTGAPPEP